MSSVKQAEKSITDRTARVSDGGAAVFLTPTDLGELGIDPDNTESLDYTVKRGRLEIDLPEGQTA